MDLPNMRSTEPGEFIHALSELNSGARLARMRMLAQFILELAQQNDGTISRDHATSTLAARLGISVDQVRYGIVYGEGNRLFKKSIDGNTIIALTAPRDEAVDNVA